MNDRARGLARAFAVALLLVSGAMGGVEFATSSRGYAPDDVWLERARFLERARPLVPAGSAVLALTDDVPPPDFDFWLGAARPVVVLARIDRARLAALYGTHEGPTPEQLEAHLRASGALLDEASLAAALPHADYVLSDLAGPSPAIPGAREILRVNGRSLIRIERP